VADLGVVTKALLAIARDTMDDRVLAIRICRACVDGLDVDGAAISLLTAGTARHTLAANDETANLLEELQFTLNEGACMEAATTGNPVLVADLLDHSGIALFARHHQCGIARQQLLQRKDQHRHEEQCRYDLRKPAGEEVQHARGVTSA